MTTKDNIRVPLLDLPKTHEPLAEELTAAFSQVLRSGRFIFGPEVDALEGECAEFLGVDHTVAVSSGTDALLAAMMALDLGPGDDVLCPAHSFFATAGCVARLGAKPVFADISEASFNSSRDDFEKALSPRCRAIIAVHLYGRCTEMGPILDLAKERQLAVIEDAAQAFGARCDQGLAGTLGDIGCFSFFPTKNLGGFGDGGLLATRDGDMAERLRRLRNHGETSKYSHAFVGGNFRMDALQAALLRIKLPRLNGYNRARRRNAELYEELFLAAGVATVVGDTVAEEHGTRPIVLSPASWPGHIFHQYMIRIRGEGQRDALKSFLAEARVQTEVYYPIPLPLQACFADHGHQPGDFPIAETAAREVLALPVYPELSIEQVRHVVASTEAFLAGGGVEGRVVG